MCICWLRYAVEDGRLDGLVMGFGRCAGGVGWRGFGEVAEQSRGEY